ncbi:MAG: hypothetical protein ABFD04_00805 [Syntrophomonas sp.]
MNRFDITEKTGYSGAWIIMFILFLAGIVVWFAFSAIAALLIAAAGMLVSLFFRLRGKKRVGQSIELNDRGMVFYEEEQARCIAFSEIKQITFSKIPGKKDVYIIETTVGNKRTLNPEDYENGGVLRTRLQESFTAYNCRIIS